MALLLDVAQLVLQARERADMENSQFVTDAEVERHVMTSYGRLYNYLVGKYEDYFAKMGDESDLTQYPTATTGFGIGVYDYAFPEEYFKLLHIEVNPNTTGEEGWYELQRVGWAQQSNYRRDGGGVPRAYIPWGDNIVGDSTNRTGSGGRVRLLPAPDKTSYRMRFVYVPKLDIDYAAEPDDDVIDHVNYWHEYIIIDVAIKLLMKEQNDVRGLVNERESLKADLENAMSPRDAGQPQMAMESMFAAFPEYEVVW